MADKPTIVIADEPSARAVEATAKATDKGLDVLARIGGYVAEVVDDLPHNLIGLVGDRVRHARRMRADELDAAYRKALADRHVTPEQPSLSVSIPIIAAAIDETREGLKQLWENLLANAMDPNRSGCVRLDLIEALRKLNPIDALVLKSLLVITHGTHTDKEEVIALQLRRTQREVVVALSFLGELGLVAGQNPGLTHKGHMLLDAVQS